MKKFITRSISGFVFAALIVGSIFLGPIALAIVFFAFLIIGLDEFSRISKLKETGSNLFLYFSSGVVLYFLIVLVTWKFLPISALAFLVFIIFIIIISQVIKRAKNPMNNLGIILISLLYIVVPLGILNALFYTNFGFETKVLFTLIGIFSITWLNDTFAYIVGSLIGKTKLAEKISPKKTWEGTIGGLIFGILGSYILFLIFPDMGLLKWIGFAIITIITGNLGDLFESLLKRSAQTKESGWIIPGHGGVLDRLDSILFAIPFIFLYTYFVI